MKNIKKMFLDNVYFAVAFLFVLPTSCFAVYALTDTDVSFVIMWMVFAIVVMNVVELEYEKHYKVLNVSGIIAGASVAPYFVGISEGKILGAVFASIAVSLFAMSFVELGRGFFQRINIRKNKARKRFGV